VRPISGAKAEHVRLATIVTLSVAILAAACGGDETGPPGTELALRQATRDYYIAFLEGDDEEAYSYYGGRCTDEVGPEEFHNLAQISRSLLELAGGDLDDFYVEDVLVRNVDGRHGEARAIVVVDASPDVRLDDLRWREWSFDDGRWLQTTCETSLE
jgi:hypothetical protein